MGVAGCPVHYVVRRRHCCPAPIRAALALLIPVPSPIAGPTHVVRHQDTPLNSPPKIIKQACEELQALDKGPAGGARSPLDSPQQASFFLQSTPPAAADPDLDPRDLFQQEGAAVAAAAGTPASVHSAMARMEAVVPRYRAAAVAAQTQTGLMREALAVAERERDAAAEEVSWVYDGGRGGV